MSKSKLSLTTLNKASQVDRAKRLAQLSQPLIAELYESHIEACEGKLGRPRRSRLAVDQETTSD